MMSENKVLLQKLQGLQTTCSAGPDCGNRVRILAAADFLAEHSLDTTGSTTLLTCFLATET